MIKKYNCIMIVHSHDANELSVALLELERIAFLDGYYFAFAIRSCNLCKLCSVDRGRQCPTPEKIRPCDQLFGIDVYKTARSLGLPCEVLTSKDDTQNRPKRHVVSLFDATQEEVMSIWKLIEEVKEALDQRFHPDGYNVGVNVGASAGQTIFHMHVHVIPRYDGDVEDPRGGIRKIKKSLVPYDGDL